MGSCLTEFSVFGAPSFPVRQLKLRRMKNRLFSKSQSSQRNASSRAAKSEHGIHQHHTAIARIQLAHDAESLLGREVNRRTLRRKFAEDTHSGTTAAAAPFADASPTTRNGIAATQLGPHRVGEQG